MYIRPDDPEHIQLEEDVRTYLKNNNFFVAELTYHTRLERPLVECLQSRYSPTALYLRGRADRIAVHKIKPVEFEWEAKTHQSQKYHDLTVEALPILHHMTKAELGVKCLYVYRDPGIREVGFWVHNMPTVRAAWLPTNRWESDLYDWFRGTLSYWFREADLVEKPIYGGTGDPFIIIDESELAGLSHWTELIAREIE